MKPTSSRSEKAPEGSPLALPRRTVFNYLPTKEWLLSRRPETKEEILSWYRRERKVLEARRFKPIKRKLTAYLLEVDAETKEVVKRKNVATDFIADCWKLSEPDYHVYVRLLEERFSQLKRVHNERITARRAIKKAVDGD